MAQPESRNSRRGEKSSSAFRTISEVADIIDVPQHVLRFWETKFKQIKPMKRGGNRRYYRPDDIELIKAIRFFLYVEGYTIKGVQKLLKEHGIKTTIDVWYRAEESGGSVGFPELQGADQETDISVDSKAVARELLGTLVQEMKALKKIVSNLPD